MFPSCSGLSSLPWPLAPSDAVSTPVAPASCWKKQLRPGPASFSPPRAAHSPAFITRPPPCTFLPSPRTRQASHALFFSPDSRPPGLWLAPRICQALSRCRVSESLLPLFVLLPPVSTPDTLPAGNRMAWQGPFAREASSLLGQRSSLPAQGPHASPRSRPPPVLLAEDRAQHSLAMNVG